MRILNAFLLLAAACARAGVVTTTADSGPGSLRQVAGEQGGLITFAPELSGQTITITSEFYLGLGPPGPPPFGFTAQSMNVDASSLPRGITIAGSGTRLFKVSSSGSLSLTGVTLTGGDGARGFPDIGGAVLSYGTVTMTRCTLTGNTGCAAAIDQGSFRMTHCTISGNSGGALANYSTGSVNLAHCTVWANGSYGGGSVYNGFRYPSITVNNCIIAGGFPPSVDVMNNGYFVRQGANIIPTFANEGQDQYPAQQSGPPAITAEPLLTPLGNYGGATGTMGLLPGSPARNAAVGSSVTSDQRGSPTMGIADIGAYEAGSPYHYNAWTLDNFPAGATEAERTATFDFDDDGRSNGDEFQAFTDPANGASFFRALVTIEEMALRISFDSAVGRSYTLEQNNTLAPEAWNGAPGAVPVTGDGSVKSFLVPRGGPRQIYRVRSSF